MPAKILDGKTLSAELRNKIALDVSDIEKRHGRAPCLAVVLVGTDAASQVYVSHKRKDCHMVGIKSLAYDLPAETPEADLLQLITQLNQDETVDGILVQLPLPAHIDADKVIEKIDPKKDVDGFHPYNLGRLAQRRPALRPCTPYGVMVLLEHYAIPLAGLNAVVVGASNIVGRPMALELLSVKATVTVCHRFTHDLAEHVKRAEILVVAMGKPGVIQNDWIRKDSIVIDIGITRRDDGTLTGDIDFEAAKEKPAWITPVPGGVGPMTRAMLLTNTLLAFNGN